MHQALDEERLGFGDGDEQQHAMAERSEAEPGCIRFGHRNTLALQPLHLVSEFFRLTQLGRSSGTAL